MPVHSGSREVDLWDALQELDELWDKLFPAEKERIVKLLVAGIVVSKDGLVICLWLNGLDLPTAKPADNGSVGSSSCRLERLISPALTDFPGERRCKRPPTRFRWSIPGCGPAMPVPAALFAPSGPPAPAAAGPTCAAPWRAAR